MPSSAAHACLPMLLLRPTAARRTATSTCIEHGNNDILKINSESNGRVRVLRRK